MTEVIIHESIAAIHHDAWNACFPNELEDYHHFLVTEHTGLAGFRLLYLTIMENGVLIAATTAFLTKYALDTTLQGIWKRCSSVVKKIFPHCFTLKLACLGYPETECCYLGFHPCIAEDRKPALLAQLLTAFEQKAQQEKISLLGIKDVPESQKYLWDICCKPRGYKAITSLSTAILTVNYATIDDYLHSLSYGTRKDMRRKLKKLADIKIEYRHHVEDVISAMMSMYEETKQRSDWQFADLTENYFIELLQKMKERALCVLYFKDNQPIAFNLLLLNDYKMLDKFFCMHHELGRHYNLYFLSWFVNVRLCIDKNIQCYQSGQVGYKDKKRLGSQLMPNWLYFKHRNPVINAILRWISPVFAIRETA